MCFIVIFITFLALVCKAYECSCLCCVGLLSLLLFVHVHCEFHNSPSWVCHILFVVLCAVLIHL